MKRKEFKAAFCFCLCLFLCVLFCPKTALAANADSSAARVSTFSGNLNVRKSASTSSEIVKSLKKDSLVTVISKSGSWSKVEYAKGKYGFAKSDFLSKKSSSAMFVKTQGGKLNVRASASKSAKVVSSLSPSQCVLVLKSDSGWSKVLFDGTKTGFVKAEFLSKEKPSYPAVKLSVVSFKQTDERWKNVKLGSSNETIGKSGCTTTAVAMVNSFALKKEVTPKELAKTLSYSQSGMLFWPSEFQTTLVSSKSEACSLIYSLLKKGKPVILGAKKENGSQHWVVVTGFSGGDSLKASLFSINDPGSKSRTTLSDFLGDYPSVYKIAHR